jgi:hypothetical protein
VGLSCGSIATKCLRLHRLRTCLLAEVGRGSVVPLAEALVVRCRQGRRRYFPISSFPHVFHSRAPKNPWTALDDYEKSVILSDCQGGPRRCIALPTARDRPYLHRGEVGYEYRVENSRASRESVTRRLHSGKDGLTRRSTPGFLFPVRPAPNRFYAPPGAGKFRAVAGNLVL